MKEKKRAESSLYSINYYLARDQKKIDVRERVEDAWKTLIQIIFYSLVILSIPFFINNLEESGLYKVTYLMLLLFFLVSNVILLNIKQETDRLVLRK